MRTAPPDWVRAFFLVACWILPVLWILLPDLLKPRSFRDLSIGHLIVTSVAFFGATIGIGFALGLIAISGLYLFESVRHGT
jgi:hypothetical protein